MMNTRVLKAEAWNVHLHSPFFQSGHLNPCCRGWCECCFRLKSYNLFILVIFSVSVTFSIFCVFESLKVAVVTDYSWCQDTEDLWLHRAWNDTVMYEVNSSPSPPTAAHLLWSWFGLHKFSNKLISSDKKKKKEKKHETSNPN